jgi:hypothetical protein
VIARWFVAAAVLTACTPSWTPVPGAYDFDNCDVDSGSALCGFVVESGMAERAPTFTAGEYGLLMHSGTTVSVPFSWDTCFHGQIGFIGMCNNASLSITATFRGVPFAFATASPGTSWQPMQVTLNPNDPSNYTSTRVPWLRLRFSVVGAGTCTIDEISIDSDGGYYGYCP